MPLQIDLYRCSSDLFEVCQTKISLHCLMTSPQAATQTYFVRLFNTGYYYVPLYDWNVLPSEAADSSKCNTFQ